VLLGNPIIDCLLCRAEQIQHVVVPTQLKSSPAPVTEHPIVTMVNEDHLSFDDVGRYHSVVIIRDIVHDVAYIAVFDVHSSLLVVVWVC